MPISAARTQAHQVFSPLGLVLPSWDPMRGQAEEGWRCSTI